MLDSGHAYPEHFHEAYEAWKELETEGRASVCTEDILACLEAGK